MLELSLNEEESIIQRVARDFLKESCPPMALREAEGSPEGYDEKVWQSIRELGWVGLPLSSEFGGEGASFTTVAVLTEELGRACYPGPLRAVWGYGLLLERLGDGDSLKALCNGQETGVPALWEADDPFNVDATSALINSDGTLSGTKLLVAYANAANRLLVLVRNLQGSLKLALVEADSVRKTVTPSSGGDRLFAVTLDGATPVKVYEANGAEVMAEVMPRLMAIDSAWMVGLGQKAFELTLDYAKTRVQFGRPIGSFQAIQHKIADIGVTVEGGRFLAYRAAWACDQSPEEARLAASYAKAWLNYATEDLIKQSHQSHGAMGMTWEYDLHLATRRLKAANLSFGDYHQHRAAVLDAYLPKVGAPV